MFGGILCAMVFALAMNSKKKHYAWVPVLLLVYEFVSDPGQYILVNITDANVISLLEKLIMILLTALVFFLTKREEAGKYRWLPGILCAVACGFRFFRSVLFRFYTGKMKVPGADVPAINQEFACYYTLVDSVMKLMILAMLFCIAWRLAAPKTTNS